MHKLRPELLVLHPGTPNIGVSRLFVKGPEDSCFVTGGRVETRMNEIRPPDQSVPAFDAGTRVFRAPGRVNLIGEHTDYNGGFVIPVAINLAAWVALSPARGRSIHVESRNLGESFEFSLDEESARPRMAWTDYVQGVALTLERAGFRLQGAKIVVESSVPIGAGLSSSAALEVATAYALLANAGLDLDPVQVARLCQRAENEFAGIRCGIMDQFTSCCGREGQAMMLNCRTLEARYLPLPKKTRLVICNTLVKHDLALSTYNERRAECEEAARRLGITSLSNISFAEFQDRVGELPPTLRKRSRHVVTENARVEEAAEALEQGDLEAFGEAMNESHLSLQNDFEVSCYELDLMVKLARAHPAAYGARMTGGGFGGCTINLVRGEAVEHFTEQVSRGYKHETGITPALYVCRAGPGAAEVAAT